MAQNDYIYFNLNLNNDRTIQSSIKNDPTSSFHDSLNGDIITDSSRWKVAIAKAHFAGKFDIPLFVPRIETDQANINQTIYIITLSILVHATIDGTEQNTTLSTSQPIMYVSQDQSQVAPSSIVSNHQDDPYYFIYSVNHWVDMVNTCFQACMSDLNVQF